MVPLSLHDPSSPSSLLLLANISRIKDVDGGFGSSADAGVDASRSGSLRRHQFAGHDRRRNSFR